MDFYKICRLCARTPTDESVNEIFSPASNLIMMKIQACCPVQIAADDGLPTKVCTLCCEKLDEYFNFRMDMMSADLILRSRLKDGKLVKTSVSPSIAIEDNADMLPIAVVLGDEGTEISDISDYTVEEVNDSTYSDDEPLAIKIKRLKRENKKKKSSRPSSICPVCGKELKDRSFREHMINVHDIGTPATPYHCNLCGKAFKTKQKMGAHKKTHSLMRFNCDQCPISYKTKALLDKHIKVKHLGIKEHICSICHKEFGEKKHWKRHLLTHTGETPFVCTICPRTFTNDWNCKKHIRNHNNNVDSSEASDVSDDEKFDDNDEIKIKPKSVCPICGKELLKSSLAEHLANVHDVGIPPTKYECDICKKVLKTSQKLRTHKKTHHTVRYHCDKCEKTFKIKSVLDRHVKIIHLGIKEHICSVCHHAFGEKKHLKQHMISHSGEKPFVCTFCPKSFTNDWNCKMHIRRHNNIRPYSCDQCDMTFIQNMELKSHLRRVHAHKKNKPSGISPSSSSSCIV